MTPAQSLPWLRGWIGLGFLALATLAAGCTTRTTRVPTRHEFDSVHMAIPFRMVLYGHDPVVVSNAAAAARARIEELNRVLSDYDPDSELSRLGAGSPHAGPVPISADLDSVLRRAVVVSRRTQGAFDITVGPMTQLWRRSRRQRALPEPAKLLAAKAAVGWSHIHFGPGRSVALTQPGMRLDAGGIAKGYAMDEAIKVLGAHGIRSALVAGAGDIRVSGPPPGEPGWKVEVAPLELPGAPPARIVVLRDASLCTSGDLYQFVEIDGVRYSHVVDPSTGLGLTQQSRVTVIGKDAMTTDALSTGLSVAPLDIAETAARAFGAAYHIVRQDGGGVVTRTSSGFARHLQPEVISPPSRRQSP